MAETVGLCSPKAQQFVDEVERVLGVDLPDCAQVQTTDEGGIIATQTNGFGTHRTVEVDAKGNIFKSLYCSDKERNREDLREPFLPWTCRDYSHLPQSGSVGLDKLAKVREMILGKK